MGTRPYTATPDAINGRYQRRTMRNKKCDAARALVLFTEQFVQEQPEDISEDISTDKCCQTDIESSSLKTMEKELQQLRTESRKMKETLTNVNLFSRSSFEGNDEKVKYFTGLPCFTILSTLFVFLEPFLPPKQSLDKFECFMLTLNRLRLNTPINQLAYQLSVSCATVSRIISDVIDVMYIRMKSFVVWPDRESLRKTMPVQFQRHFGKNCAVIIDCFEVFIERPSNLRARAETWSSYKHHNTVKFLIGISPQGVISFISRSWGGRCSDKHITENCGFLNNIMPGDLVLADRGFDIQSSVGSLYGELKIPAFTKGKDQLNPVAIESTRQIANVRIHVERVIGLVRQKYTILNDTLPIDLVITKDKDSTPSIDKIAHVCCSLVNLCDSVVDFN